MARKIENGLLTAEEFSRLPDPGFSEELVEGLVLSEPVPRPEHGRVAARLVMILGSFIEPRGLGEIYTCDAGYILARGPDTVRGPDVSFISKDRLRAAGSVASYFPGAPDLAVEILSPDDRRGAVREKVADYLAAGTRMVWLLDSASQRVRVYRTLHSPRLLTADEELGGEDVIPGFRCTVRGLFDGPLPVPDSSAE